MAFNINDFRSNLPGGGARANLYEVRIPTPAALSGYADQARQITYLAKTASIPGSTITPVELNSQLSESNTKYDPILYSKILEKNGIYYEMLGKSQKGSLDLDKEFNIKLEDLCKFNSLWFKNYFKEE